MESGEKRVIPLKTGVQQGDALGLALFCMSPGSVMEKTKTIYHPKGVELVRIHRLPGNGAAWSRSSLDGWLPRPTYGQRLKVPPYPTLNRNITERYM